MHTAAFFILHLTYKLHDDSVNKRQNNSLLIKMKKKIKTSYKFRNCAVYHRHRHAQMKTQNQWSWNEQIKIQIIKKLKNSKEFAAECGMNVSFVCFNAIEREAKNYNYKTHLNFFFAKPLKQSILYSFLF